MFGPSPSGPQAPIFFQNPNKPQTGVCRMVLWWHPGVRIVVLWQQRTLGAVPWYYFPVSPISSHFAANNYSGLSRNSQGPPYLIQRQSVKQRAGIIEAATAPPGATDSKGLSYHPTLTHNGL